MTFEQGEIYAMRDVPEPGKCDDPEDELTLVTDSQDVEYIHELYPSSADYDGFFVRVRDGDYDLVLGFVGSVPYLYKNVECIVGGEA